VCRVFKSGRLNAVHCLGQSAMQEGILHIKLVHGPLPRQCQGENCANRSWLYHRTERLREIHTWALGETPKNPARFVPLQCPICMELVLEDPLARHHVGTRWSRHEIPSVVLQKGSMLFLHGGAPTRVIEVLGTGASGVAWK
jgi:hypothetical protein